MAIDESKLAGYITTEIVDVFNLGQSNESLDKYAAALSRAISKYLEDDIEVAVGVQVAGQGEGTDSAGDTVTIQVTGKTTTKGKLL